MPTQRKYAFFAFFTTAIVFLALYIHQHRQGQTGRIDNLLVSSIGKIQEQFYYFGHGARSIVSNYVLLVNAKKNNEELQREVDSLRTKLATLQEVENENARLRASLDFKSEIKQPVIAAHVVAHDASADYYSLRIDRGENDGIRVGMGVISKSGVVGRVLRTTANYSDIMTLIDPSSNIDVIVQRSRARGILSGQSKQLNCKFKYIDRLEDVQVNDTVVSSGFGGIFPAGLLVGAVTSVVPNTNGILQNVVVKAAVDIYRLEEVFIVLPANKSEKTS